MNIKYRSGYAEGGFLDDGASVDPVSGNEVPVGSLAEEVRDDVPAQLSEGEFVVPADVVRYIGLEKLMKMRETAKAGLANMEADGQMGGQPAPIMEEPMMGEPMMDDSLEMDELIDGMDSEGFEGAVQQFADGGSVIPTYKDYTGNEFGSPTTVTFSTYINAAGDKITIPTLRGKPLRPVPEGYTLVVPVSDGGTEEEGGGKVDPVETAPMVSGGESRPTDGTAALTRDYKKNMGSSGYQADLRRSESIRRDRANTIESLASPNMSKAEMDVMYAALTPQAKMIYDTRFRDESTRGFLDGFMSDGKSPTDLLITAQKTADSINRAAGKVEPDSGFMPDGEPIDWAKAIKYVAAGFAMGPTGLIGVAGKNFTDEELEDIKGSLTAVGKVLGSIGDDSPFKDNTVQPNKPVNDPYTKLNQAYWQTFTGDVAAEKRRLEGLTGLNAYGHKIYKEPGTRTVWDNIAEVEANKQNTRDLQALRATEAQDAKNLAEVKANRAAAVEKAKAYEAAKKEAALDKQEKDRAAANAQALALDKARKDQAAIDAATVAAKAAQNNLPPSPIRGGGNGDPSNKKGDNSTPSGPVGGSTSGPKSRGGRQRQQQSQQQNSGREDYAQGGLATKMKPVVKKMRSDPTAGLASKKIAKQKAQAKKGALAAKRT